MSCTRSIVWHLDVVEDVLVGEGVDCLSPLRIVALRVQVLHSTRVSASASGHSKTRCACERTRTTAENAHNGSEHSAARGLARENCTAGSVGHVGGRAEGHVAFRASTCTGCGGKAKAGEEEHRECVGKERERGRMREGGGGEREVGRVGERRQTRRERREERGERSEEMRQKRGERSEERGARSEERGARSAERGGERREEREEKEEEASAQTSNTFFSASYGLYGSPLFECSPISIAASPCPWSKTLGCARQHFQFEHAPSNYTGPSTILRLVRRACAEKHCNLLVRAADSGR
eukprot:3346812-Rhodomonas_salina.2